MYESAKNALNEEMKAFLLKIIIPAMIGISMKLAIDARSKKVSILNIVVSFITGIGAAALSSGLVIEECSATWQPIVIACIAISGEKLGGYFMNKLNVEAGMSTFIEVVTKIFKK